MGLLDSVLGAIGGGQAGPGGGQGGGGRAALIALVVGLLANRGAGGGGLGGGGGGLGGLGGLAGSLGGLGGLVSRFQQGGLGDVVSSWIGHGQNQPVSPDEVHGVLGTDLVSQIAQHLGVSQQEAAGHLSQVLPEVVDQMTPNGELPADGGIDGIGDILARFPTR